MMRTDSLFVAVHGIVLSGVSSYWLSACRGACIAEVDSACQELHIALSSAQPSNVQASCLERAWPAAMAAFIGGRAARAAAPPSRRRRERKRQAKAEGKIKGCGTSLREEPVCTWGWRGTRRIGAPCRVVSQYLVGIELRACFSSLPTLVLAGGAI